MMNKVYPCTQHIFGWFASGAGFKDFGFTMPVGVVAAADGVEHLMADGLAQDLTQWLGVAILAVTLFIKVYNFVKKNKK